MFNKATALPSPLADHDVMEQGDSPGNHLIPVSYLVLDLPEPGLGGWPVYLAAKGIEVVTDDLGRPAISRDDVRQLLDEQRELEARNREALARREEQLVQQDQLRRASMPTGIPWVPDGMTPAEAMMLHGESSSPRARSVREQLLEKELSHRGPELIYQPLNPDEG